MARHELDPDDPSPPFRQVADLVRRRIRSGEYQPGARLPGRAQLSAEFGVAHMTVQRALDVLRQEGLIVSRQGQGVFVRTHPERNSVPVSEIRELIARVEASPWHDSEAVRDILGQLRALLQP